MFAVILAIQFNVENMKHDISIRSNCDSDPAEYHAWY